MGWVIKVYCNVERIFDNAAVILRIVSTFHVLFTYCNSYFCYQLHVCIGKMLWARTIENTKEESRFYTFYD